MNLKTKIAALRRRIMNAEQDRSLFLQRIADYAPEQQKLAIRMFDSVLEEDRKALCDLLSKEHPN